MDPFDWRDGKDGVDFSSIGLVERLLLITNGTLTDAIEAAFLEPVKLFKLAVSSSVASEPIEALNLKRGAPVMRREILLQGVNSQTTYVYAKTFIALESLSSEFREQLANSEIPIGRLWAEHKLETRKELVKIWRIPVSEVSLFFGAEGKGGLLARTYRVFSGGRPIMLISEYFPASLNPAK